MSYVSKTIILETTGCYSNLCPSYRATIDVDKNKVIYFGKINVKHTGVHVGKIPSFHLNILVEFIESTPFFGMNQFYSGGHVDQQEIKITIILKDGRQKTVVYDGESGPAQLYAIRLMIDHVIGKSVWKS